MKHITATFLPGLHRGPSCKCAASPQTVKNWRKLCPEVAEGVFLQGGQHITNSRIPLKICPEACEQLSVVRGKTLCQAALKKPVTSVPDNRY